MSQATLDILDTHRAAQIETSPSSEEFQIVGGDSFQGIFDEAHQEDKNDDGNVLQKKLTPMIMVSTIPSGIVERQTKIIRETAGYEYTFNFAGKDDRGVPILWLF